MAKMHTLVDYFDDGVVDTTKWAADLNPFGQAGANSITESGGKLNIVINKASVVYAQLESLVAYDIQESQCAVLFTDYGPDATGMERSLLLTKGPRPNQGGDGIQIDLQHSGIGPPSVLFRVEPNHALDQQVQLPSTNPVWVRCRETGGTTFLEYTYKPRAGWTTVISVSTATAFATPAAVFAYIQFGEDNGTGGVDYTLSVDNFNGLTPWADIKVGG